MASWSEKRKLLYGSIVAVILVGGIGLPAFLLFYDAPTCFDGKQNGSEKGVDCGGKCSRLCQSDFLAPSVSWTRLEQVVPGVYNAAAYIINPNATGEAKKVPYRMSLYDREGVLITEKNGVVTLPPHRNTLAFQGLVRVSNSVPSKVLFEFTERPDWNKSSDTLTFVNVIGKDYTEEGSGSSLNVSLRNDGTGPVRNMSVYAILYDRAGNAIGFSKTIVDEILPQSTVKAPFTWNINRQGEVVSIEVLYVAE